MSIFLNCIFIYTKELMFAFEFLSIICKELQKYDNLLV